MSAPTTIAAPVVRGEVTALASDASAGAILIGTAAGELLRLAPGAPAVRLGPTPGGPIVAVAAHAVTGALAAADRTGTVRVLPTDRPPASVELGGRPRALAWSPDRPLLALASQAVGVLVVDEHGGRRAALAPSRRWRRLAWQPSPPGDVDPALLVAVGTGGCTWIDPEDAHPILRAERHDGVAVGVAVAPGSGVLAVGDLRGAVRLLPGGDDEVEVLGWPDPVERLAWTADGSLVVLGGDEATAWHPSDEEAEPVRTVGRGWLSALAAHPWSGAVALGSSEGEVAVWHPATGARAVLAAVDGRVAHLGWDRSGEHLLAAGPKGAWWCAFGASGAAA